jgi:hypothetical protein
MWCGSIPISAMPVATAIVQAPRFHDAGEADDLDRVAPAAGRKTGTAAIAE